MTTDREIAVMGKIAEALDTLGDDREAVQRVLRWASARFPAKEAGAARRAIPAREPATTPAAEQVASEFAVMGDLYHAFSPRTDPERALAAGYWFQAVRLEHDFTSHQASTELKHVGHRVGNISDALHKLMRRHPSLVEQTGKTGSSKHARKRYRLTDAGLRFFSERLKERQKRD